MSSNAAPAKQTNIDGWLKDCLDMSVTLTVRALVRLQISQGWRVHDLGHPVRFAVCERRRELRQSQPAPRAAFCRRQQLPDVAVPKRAGGGLRREECAGLNFQGGGYFRRSNGEQRMSSPGRILKGSQVNEPYPETDQKISADADNRERPPGLDMKDPTDTDHPVGAAQAVENAANESPS